MPKRVPMPTGDVFEAPDDWSQEQIDAAIEKLTRQISVQSNSKKDSLERKEPVMADVVKSALIGVPKGLAGLFGMVGDVRGMVPERSGERGVIERAADIANQAANPAYAIAKRMPTSANVRDEAERLTGEWYDAQTTPGKYAQAIAGAVTGMALPKPSWLGALLGLVGGSAGEAVAQAVPDKPLLSAAASMGATLPVAAIASKTPQLMAGLGELKSIDNKKVLAAKDLAKASREMGSPVTGLEALAKTSGMDSITDAQRVVEQTRGGAPVMAEFMSKRAPGTEKAFKSSMRGMGDSSGNAMDLPRRLSSAAKEALDDTRYGAQRAADKFYDDAMKQLVPEDELAQIRKSPVVSHALDVVGRDPYYDITDAIPQNSLQRIDAAKKYLDDQIVQIERAQMNPDSERVAVIQKAINKLTDLADAVSPEYAKARSIYTKTYREKIEPMQQGIVGALAKEPRAGTGAENIFAEQANVLMPKKPFVTEPRDIRKAIEAIKAQDASDPGILREWTSNNLSKIFDDTTKRLASGENQWGGAKYAAIVAANKNQAKNLQALVEGVGGKEAYSGFRRFLDVMEAQGTRKPKGSATAFNQLMAEDFERGGVGNIASVLASPARWTTFVNDWYKSFRMGKSSEEMAKIITSEDSVDKLIRLAKTKPGSAKEKALVSQLIFFSSGGREPDE